MSNDSMVQLEQARTGVYSDIQPFMMSLLWRYIEFVWRGQTGLMIVQNYVYWLGILLIFAGQPSQITRSSIAGLLPPVFLLGGVIWKDVLMNSLLLLSVGLMQVATAAPSADALTRQARASWLLLGLAFTAAFAAMLMRHNAIFAAPPLFYYLAHLALHRSAAVIHGRRLYTGTLALALVVISGLVVVQLNASMASTRRPLLVQLLAVYDLIGIGVAQGKPALAPDEYPSIVGLFSSNVFITDEIAKLYNPCDAFPLFVSHTWGDRVYTETMEPAKLRELYRAWRTAVARHPTSYLVHRTKVFLCSLGIGTMGPWYAATFFYVPPEATKFNVHWSGLSVAQRSIARAAERLSKTLVYSVYLYFCMALAVGFLSLFRPSFSNDLLAGCVVLSGVLYQLSYLALGITTEFRFYTWLIASAWMGTLLWLSPRLHGRFAANRGGLKPS